MQKAIDKRKKFPLKNTTRRPAPYIPTREQSTLARFADSDQDDESMEAVENVMEVLPQQQQCSSDGEEDLQDEQENEKAHQPEVTQEVSEDVLHGALGDEIAAPKVAQVEETCSTTKIRPVCHVAPMRRPPTGRVHAVPIVGPPSRIIVLSDDSDDSDDDEVTLIRT